ncbi:response regulator transcription factor [Serratia sp. UGAL515B_01]|uniref:response regulator transcription factor n=1 Tax=Serratia sp. UGAL515B_01 TaxID=2986763 RepID=UPI00295460A5|nr:response regulator transcription factor [Serratia sp. UGAL515B_01]WON77736.1 response regulator transcription factor [Serratia sp. UGAL515B_01]
MIIELMGNGDSVLDALRIINHCIRYWPHIPVVVCTELHHAPLFQLLRAMDVRGIYLKQEPIDTLIQCIENAWHGSHKFSPMVSHSLQKMEQVTHSPLTEKELEVMVFLLSGKNVTTIAKLMHRDIRTVSTHKRSAMRKIGFKNDSEILSHSQWMIPHNKTYSLPLSQQEDDYGK